MNPSISPTCAVIVTYNPDGDFPARLSAIMKQVDHAIVVDNATASEPYEVVRRACAGPQADLIRNTANLGIATALNQGVRLASQKGYRSVVTFDQDTAICEGLILRLLAVYASASQSGRVAMVGAGYVGDGAHLGKAQQRAPAAIEETEVIVTSGSLLSIAAYEAIGAFRDDFFMDHVDTDYCLRARKAGYKIIAVREVLMIHPIGIASTHRLLWRRLQTTNHAPFRRYYNSRNLFILVREHLLNESRWALHTMTSWVKTIIMILLLENNRWTKLKAIARGMRDGLMLDMRHRPKL
jgi:rhamnosyltransferase